MAEFSSGPAGRMATWWLEVINSDSVLEGYGARMVPGATPMYDLATEDGRRTFFQFYNSLRPWQLIAVGRETPVSVEAVVADGSGRQHDLHVQVEPDEPHRITLAGLVPRLGGDDASDRPPSMTAVMTATARAAHVLWSQPPPVLNDYLAIRLLPEVMAERVRSGAMPAPAASASAMVVVRSRYAEDTLMMAAARGVRQYVILGAGLDSFAYRQPPIAGLRVFEVDEPASQLWKRRRLAAAGIVEPDSVIFAAVDFRTQSLAERLSAAGLDASGSAVFAWLGVIYYLDAPAIDSTLRFIATFPAGSELVLDYMDPTVENVVPTAARLTQTVGETLVSHHTPEEIAEIVRSAGLHVVRDFGPSEATNDYFARRSDEVHPSGQLRVLHARV